MALPALPATLGALSAGGTPGCPEPFWPVTPWAAHMGGVYPQLFSTISSEVDNKKKGLIQDSFHMKCPE